MLEMNFKENLEQFYKKSGNSYDRYNSWEHCYLFFSDFKNKNKKDFDLAALNLAFYLASWGMYRGSSFLLQYDYKIHIEFLEKIFDAQYNFDTLWNIKYNTLNNQNAINDYLKELEKINEIINTYYYDYSKNYCDEVSNKKKWNKYNKSKFKTGLVSDTLVTKIIMGIFACVPAYDRFFEEGLKELRNVQKINNSCTNCVKTCKCDSCSYINPNYTRQSIEFLIKFIKNNKDIWFENEIYKYKLHNKENMDYPIMKLVDMCFWQIGYNNSFSITSLS